MAKEKQSETVQLLAIKRQSIAIRIKGITPLLLNKFGDQALSDMEAEQFGRAKPPKRTRNIEEEVREKLHLCEDGRYGFPSAGIKKAAATAAFRIGVAKSIVGPLGLFSIPQFMIPIEADEPTVNRSWGRLDNGTPMTIYRPQFWPWSMTIPIVYLEGPISAEQVVNMLNLAGASVGIGAHRVENKGINGQFEVVAE